MLLRSLPLSTSKSATLLPRWIARSEWRKRSAVDCVHQATRFELEHGQLRLAVRLCPFHFEELAALVKRQGADWSATRGKYDWIESRLWAASKGLKSGL
jgi:hypothetical protein